MTFIAAYIAVMKGSEIGVESVSAQQMMLYEQKMNKKGIIPPQSFCPRSNAIQCLKQLMEELQKQQHAIILMLDANQSIQDCYNSKGLKKHSIEWLKTNAGWMIPL